MKETNKKPGLVDAMTFDKVAKPREKARLTDNNNNDVNTNNNVNVNNSTNDNNKVSGVLNEIPDYTQTVKKKRIDGYIDPDVWEALNEFSKAKGKGAKSELINKLLRKAFELE